VLVLALLFVVGLINGGGDLARLFGITWTQVDWPGVASMIVFVLLIAVILIPLAWFLLPRSIKKAGTLFVAMTILTPLGLIAPGFAYGEGAPEDVQAAFGYVPQGLQDLSGLFSAPLADYNIPLPFFSAANAPLWHAAIGYEICAILGMLALGLCILGIGYLLHWRGGRPPASMPLTTSVTESTS
jgi:hypothetical protein